MVFLPIKKATRTNSTGIITMSQLIRYATNAAAKKAVIAVKNQPPTTLITPATLYTALSLPQALSAKEVPMATIKVT